MGDIIGRGFDKYVRDQVIKRQEKLKYGQTDVDVIRWNNANNAFLRLSSGVNVSENFVKDKLELDSNTYKGNLLAKHFKLFAAQTYDATSKKYNFTKGVGYNFNSSYGFASPEYTSYGLVPPPGIISATIKSLNRGSLREATVSIKCHNLQQFQIIEALYLRLKYSLLLEWGHSLYFNKDGILTNSTHDLSDTFLDGGISQTSVLTRIQKEREASDGNYDAFFGLVTNFDWTVNPDGGYDINMIARAAGDVIESLKINSNTPSNKALPTGTAKTHLETDAYKSTLNRILWTIAENVNAQAGRNFAHGLDDGSGKFRVNNSSLGTPSYTKSGGDTLTWNEAFTYEFGKLTPGWMTNRQSYIKLGTLLRIIESFLVFYDNKNSNDPIFKIDYDFVKNYCFTFPRHASINPKICLIPYPTKTSTAQLQAGGLFFKRESKVITRVYFPSTDPKSKDKPLNEGIINSPNFTELSGAQVIDVKGSFVIIKDVTSPPAYGPVLPGYTPSTDGTSLKVYTFKANIPYYLGELRSNNGNQINAVADTLVKDSAFWGTLQNQNLESQDAIFNQEYITWVEQLTSTNTKVLVESKNYGQGSNSQSTNPIITYLVTGSNDPLPPKTITRNRQGFNEGIDINTFPITIETITVAIDTYSNTNASGVFSSTTGQTVYKDLEKDNKPGFKNTSELDNYAGKTMNIHVNMEYIAETLSKSIDDKDGTAKLYDFLKKLMSGIQNALGNVNNFEVIYTEDTNTFRIIDNTLIPGQFQKLDSENKKIVEFLITADGTQGTNGGSFIHNINFRTKLSNAFATMATVGAQANGATVGEDATALSKWNVGLTDRIIQTRVGSGPQITDNTNAEALYINNIVAFQNVINKTNEALISDDEILQAQNAATDIFKTQISAFSLKSQASGSKSGITPLGFIPFDLELNMMGLSGPRIYESYTIDTRLLPKSYQDAIQFICSGISHTISDGEWKTTLNSICGPKQEGAIIEGMPAADPATAAAAAPKSEGKIPSAKPDEVCGASSNNVNTTYPRSTLWNKGSMPPVVNLENTPSLKIDLDIQPEVSYVQTIVTPQEYVVAAEAVINQLIPSAPKDVKYKILRSAFAISRTEQGGPNGGFQGFNNNISGIEKSGFKVFWATDVIGKVSLPEKGTTAGYKFYYAFSSIQAGLVPLISNIVTRNMFDTSGGLNEWSWRWFRDWNGYGARGKIEYESDCITVNRVTTNYNSAQANVDKFTTFK